MALVFGTWPGFARQHVDRLRADDGCALVRREHGQQRDHRLEAGHFVPWQPDAVGITQIGDRVASGQLFVGKHEFSTGRLIWGFRSRIVEPVDDQLSIDGYRLVSFVIEVQSAPEAANGWVACLRIHRIRPDGHDANRDRIAGGAGSRFLGQRRKLVAER